MANVMRYSPFSDFVSLREAMDRLLEDSFIPRAGFGTRGVASNLHETADNFILQVPMPGVKPENVEITAQQDSLNLKWQTSVNVPENATTHWSGFAAGEYQQSFMLPAPIDADKADARYENGILILTLPKAERARTRTLKITTTKH